jgi:hypothetical protein
VYSAWLKIEQGRRLTLDHKHERSVRLGWGNFFVRTGEYDYVRFRCLSGLSDFGPQISRRGSGSTNYSEMLAQSRAE